MLKPPIAGPSAVPAYRKSTLNTIGRNEVCIFFFFLNDNLWRSTWKLVSTGDIVRARLRGVEISLMYIVAPKNITEC